ncbi:MAG: ribosome silencing factor [Dissulfurispiraceae bacterium]|nr:ribosome silencing factor [Dissulfurispiraceae bacterium]
MKAKKAAAAASDKKAKDITILKLRDVSVICDYFVICSGGSTTQVNAISEHVEKVLREKGCSPIGFEGKSNAHWVLIDYGDVIVHVFEEDTRQYYELERLWLDAPRIDFKDEGKNTMDRKD